MTTKKLTHAELAAAQERKDWALLWQHAMPLVKLVIKRMRKDGVAQSDNADDDGELLQQGMLLAGEAMRAWKPLECSYSTWITRTVEWELSRSTQEANNVGIGSYKQNPTVLSLGDERPDAKSDMDTGEDGGDEGGEGGTFDAALTYAGVVRPGGQYDGDGLVPQGFGDPSEEADVGADARVRAVLQHLSERDQHMLRSIYGIGGGRPQPVAEYAAAHNIPLRTLERHLAETKLLLAVTLRNFAS